MKTLVLIVAMAILLVPTALAYADVYPAFAPLKGSMYIEAETTLGRVLLLFPSNTAGYITQYNNSADIVNTSSSTLTGRMYTGSSYFSEYTFRMSSFGGVQYQTTVGYTTTWVDIAVTEICNTNMQLLNNYSNTPPRNFDTVLNLLSVFLLGVIALCLFMKH